MRTWTSSVLTTAAAMLFASAAHAQGLQAPPPLTQAQQQPYVPQQYPQQQYPQGGLQAPPPLAQSQQPWAPQQQGPGTQQQLEQSERDDSGRGFEVVWANAEVGASYLGLGKDLGYAESTSSGLMVGAGAGVRLLFVTLGARFRLHPHSDYTAWQLTGEAGFHLPLGKWDPYANLHLGYVSASPKNTNGFDLPSPHGFDLGLSIGSDYYLSSLFSLGLDASADLLFLSRAASSEPILLITPLGKDASSTGIALVGSLHAGLHFDL